MKIKRLKPLCLKSPRRGEFFCIHQGASLCEVEDLIKDAIRQDKDCVVEEYEDFPVVAIRGMHHKGRFWFWVAYYLMHDELCYELGISRAEVEPWDWNFRLPKDFEEGSIFAKAFSNFVERYRKNPMSTKQTCLKCRNHSLRLGCALEEDVLRAHGPVAHHWLEDPMRKNSCLYFEGPRKNPLTPAEAARIRKVAREHSKDAGEHKSTELRHFDAGTAAGLNEALAIVRSNPYKKFVPKTAADLKKIISWLVKFPENYHAQAMIQDIVKNPSSYIGREVGITLSKKIHLGVTHPNPSGYYAVKKGQRVGIRAHKSAKGKGLTYPAMTATMLEDGFTGGWDVWEVLGLDGREYSVYGFSIYRVTRPNAEMSSRKAPAILSRLIALVESKAHYDRNADYHLTLLKGINPKKASVADIETINDLAEMYGVRGNPLTRNEVAIIRMRAAEDLKSAKALRRLGPAHYTTAAFQQGKAVAAKNIARTWGNYKQTGDFETMDRNYRRFLKKRGNPVEPPWSPESGDMSRAGLRQRIVRLYQMINGGRMTEEGRQVFIVRMLALQKAYRRLYGGFTFDGRKWTDEKPETKAKKSGKPAFGSIEWQRAMMAGIEQKVNAGVGLSAMEIRFLDTQEAHERRHFGSSGLTGWRDAFKYIQMKRMMPAMLKATHLRKSARLNPLLKKRYEAKVYRPEKDDYYYQEEYPYVAVISSHTGDSISRNFLTEKEARNWAKDKIEVAKKGGFLFFNPPKHTRKNPSSMVIIEGSNKGSLVRVLDWQRDKETGEKFFKVQFHNSGVTAWLPASMLGRPPDSTKYPPRKNPALPAVLDDTIKVGEHAKAVEYLDVPKAQAEGLSNPTMPWRHDYKMKGVAIYGHKDKRMVTLFHPTKKIWDYR